MSTILPPGSSEGEASTLALAILMPILGAIAVGLRFFARLRQKRGFGMDDWLVLSGILNVVN